MIKLELMELNLHGDRLNMNSWKNGILNIKSIIKIMNTSKVNGKIMDKSIVKIKILSLHWHMKKLFNLKKQIINI